MQEPVNYPVVTEVKIEEKHCRHIGTLIRFTRPLSGLSLASYSILSDLERQFGPPNSSDPGILGRTEAIKNDRFISFESPPPPSHSSHPPPLLPYSSPSCSENARLIPSGKQTRTFGDARTPSSFSDAPTPPTHTGVGDRAVGRKRRGEGQEEVKEE
ncbi:hypothetical protein Aperf_G00000005692 [Anoplocephala perfoliata]